jgi:hypothetical protein
MPRKFRQHLGYSRQLVGAVTLTSTPDRRDIRRIRFQHDGIERQGGRQFADAARAGKLMAPPKPSLKPSLMNSSACWRLPLKAWAMPPGTVHGANA